jgi:hypothetical protein
VPDNKFYIPVKSIINLKTGTAETEVMEVTEEQYMAFLDPFAEILAEGFVNELLKSKAG